MSHNGMASIKKKKGDTFTMMREIFMYNKYRDGLVTSCEGTAF